MSRMKAPFEGEMLETVPDLRKELYGKWREMTSTGSVCKHCKCSQIHPFSEVHYDFCPVIKYNRVYEDRYPNERTMNSNGVQLHIYHLT